MDRDTEDAFKTQLNDKAYITPQDIIDNVKQHFQPGIVPIILELKISFFTMCICFIFWMRARAPFPLFISWCRSGSWYFFSFASWCWPTSSPLSFSGSWPSSLDFPWHWSAWWGGGGSVCRRSKSNSVHKYLLKLIFDIFRIWCWYLISLEFDVDIACHDKQSILEWVGRRWFIKK